MHSTQPESRKAFAELLDTLREVDRDYFCEKRNISSLEDIANGEHYLTHLLKTALNLYVDNDAARPHFEPIITPTQKLGGDGPDHHVFFAPLDDRRDYVIRGRNTGEVYISFTVHTTDGEGGWGTGVISEINDSKIDFAEDKSYAITLSRKEGGGNWMKMDDGASVLITRHYFENRRPAMFDPEVRPELSITPLGEASPPLPYAPQTLADKLRAAARYIRGHTLERPLQTAETTPAWFSLTPNQFNRPEIWENKDGGGFGAVDNAYTAAPFLIGPDQALIMEGALPPCRYANVCLWNRYLQTFDYRYRNIGLNRAQMTLDGNRYRIVVAHEKPNGCPDWLDTGGQGFGIVYWRFLMPEGEIDTPECRVVPAAQA